MCKPFDLYCLGTCVSGGEYRISPLLAITLWDPLRSAWTEIWKPRLKIFYHASHNTWDVELPWLSLAFNTAVHESTGVTPDKLFLKDQRYNVCDTVFIIHSSNRINIPTKQVSDNLHLCLNGSYCRTRSDQTETWQTSANFPWWLETNHTMLTHWPLSGRTRSCRRKNTPLSLVTPSRRDTKWLGHSHLGRAVAIDARGWNTSLWLGHRSDTHSSDNIHESHSNAQNECKQTVWCRKSHLKHSGLSNDVKDLHVLLSHVWECGWDTVVRVLSGPCAGSPTAYCFQTFQTPRSTAGSFVLYELCAISGAINTNGLHKGKKKLEEWSRMEKRSTRGY
jgi:hypothetical protein